MTNTFPEKPNLSDLDSYLWLVSKVMGNGMIIIVKYKGLQNKKKYFFPLKDK